MKSDSIRNVSMTFHLEYIKKHVKHWYLLNYFKNEWICNDRTSNLISYLISIRNPNCLKIKQYAFKEVLLQLWNTLNFGSFNLLLCAVVIIPVFPVSFSKCNSQNHFPTLPLTILRHSKWCLTQKLCSPDAH